MAKLLLGLWIALFAGLFYMCVRFADPGPPRPWRHEWDTPAITTPDGSQAWCLIDGATIVEPGGFCTEEGIEE